MANVTSNRKGDRVVDFDEEGVTFIFPPELDDIFVLRKDLYKPPTKGGFEAKRPIINVKLFRIQNGKALPITTFKPSFQIEIHYKESDDKDGKECAFWIESTETWVKFTEKDHGFIPEKYDPKKHKKKIKDKYKGIGVVSISEWPDPVMGWGP